MLKILYRIVLILNIRSHLIINFTNEKYDLIFIFALNIYIISKIQINFFTKLHKVC